MEKTKTDYQRAVTALNSRQFGALFYKPAGDNKQIDMMNNCLGRIGLKMDDIEKLPIIHVAGTKGKGSTCEYVRNLLQLHGYKTVGVYTSPFVTEMRERCRINGKPVSEEIFCDAFWHVFSKILITKKSNEDRMPGYIALNVLIAFYIFLKQGVDVVVMETEMGGEFDATNFIQRPAVCGIASIYLEETEKLGFIVVETGWHKADIMKKGVPLVTVPQQDSVMAVILNKAKDIGCPVFVAPPIKEEELGGTLGIAGDHQMLNAGLALQLCRIFLEQESKKKQGQGDAHTVQDPFHQASVTRPEDIPRRESTNLTPVEKEGLRKTKLPGRTQIVKKGHVTYYLDSADMAESMQQCVAWFKETASKEAEELGGNVYQSFVFCMKVFEKKTSDYLPELKDLGFQRAAFCPHVISTSAMEEFPGFSDNIDLRIAPEEAKEIAAFQLEHWEKIKTDSTSCSSRCFPSIASALWWAGLHRDTQTSQPPLGQLAVEDLRLESEKEEEAGQAVEKGGAKATDDPVASDVTHVQVLVTGNICMVGGALAIIKPDLWD